MKDMNAVEMLVAKTEENERRKILELAKECETLEEFIEKLKAILKQK